MLKFISCLEACCGIHKKLNRMKSSIISSSIPFQTWSDLLHLDVDRLIPDQLVQLSGSHQMLVLKLYWWPPKIIICIMCHCHYLTILVGIIVLYFSFFRSFVQNLYPCFFQFTQAVNQVFLECQWLLLSISQECLPSPLVQLCRSPQLNQYNQWCQLPNYPIDEKKKKT